MKQGILFSFGFVVRRNINFKSKDWEVQIHCHYFDIQKTDLKAPSDKEQLKLELLSAFDAAEEFIRESAYYQQKAAQCSQKALSLQKQALLKNLDYG